MVGLAPPSRIAPLSRIATARWHARVSARGALALAGAALSATVVLTVLSTAAPERRGAAAVGAGLTVAVPVTIGVLAWRAQPDGRFARLLVAVGAASSFTALAHSSDSVLYSMGRVSIWLV